MERSEVYVVILWECSEKERSQLLPFCSHLLVVRLNLINL